MLATLTAAYFSVAATNLIAGAIFLLVGRNPERVTTTRGSDLKLVARGVGLFLFALAPVWPVMLLLGIARLLLGPSTTNPNSEQQ